MGFDKRLLDHMDFDSARNRPNSLSLVIIVAIAANE